jgi:hypothetical protein
MNRKEIAIEEKLNEPFKVGEEVLVKRRFLQTYNQDDYEKRCVISSIGEQTAFVVENEYRNTKAVEIPLTALTKDLFNTGYNPIVEKTYRLDTVSYSMESIVHAVGFDRTSKRFVETKDIVGKIEVPELNWNPYVFQADGSRFHYQRNFCWGLEEKQNLIESIYNNISIGRIIVRERGYKWIKTQIENGNQDVAFKDIVDGKQRINAIIEFMMDKWPDKSGYFYSEFSAYAIHKFLDHQLLGYASLDENATDKDVIECFLKTNFAGVPMSADHINYVRGVKF